jgi:hypothetical protein
LKQIVEEALAVVVAHAILQGWRPSTWGMMGFNLSLDHADPVLASL